MNIRDTGGFWLKEQYTMRQIVKKKVKKNIENNFFFYILLISSFIIILISYFQVSFNFMISLFIFSYKI